MRDPQTIDGPDRHTEPSIEGSDSGASFYVRCPSNLGDETALDGVEFTTDQRGEVDGFEGECYGCDSWIKARAIGGFRFEVVAETPPLP